MGLTKEEIERALELGLSEEDVLEGRRAGLTMEETRAAQRLHVRYRAYAGRKGAETVDNWLDAEQRRMMRGLAGGAETNTEIGAKLREMAEHGVKEPEPVAWWTSDVARDVAFKRAEARDPVRGRSDLSRAEYENSCLIREGKRATVPIPERLR
jgi:hypothetical protein